ncbi:MAG: tRNA (adenosine(37)-N6)-dimethylallyltransferase MiaA, partial [Candidatus Eisenbacteria bacterium]|nr:tRNA (adenosine(37)-N6)-dimethylallyltransferase MiaA [Candidatus Eisenbacteria bacterium]
MIEPMVLLGPTAAGKTDVSLDLAEQMNAEIISLDSRQIFKGLEIGSAAPTKEQQERITHHLVSCIEPSHPMSAGEFGRLAQAAIAEIKGRGKNVLMVGGSGLYLRAALGGLDDELPKDVESRAKLHERMETEGLKALHEELAEIDPKSAERISPGDSHRVLRALELYVITGKPASQLRTKGRRTDIPSRVVILHRDLEDLEERIEQRAENMVKAGLEQEVRALVDQGLTLETPVMRSVGYRETLDYFEHKDADQWVRKIVTGTRRYAKRQRTWFRGLTHAHWFLLEGSEDTQATAEELGEIFEQLEL